MLRSSTYCTNIVELGRYLRISYAKALDLANDPHFPKDILVGNVFPKAQIVAWVAKRIKIK
ncbi:MAG: hypothetical protein NHB14_20615 [Desulfosporosinus sp.]|nr:hypothetical protein [Desulfosporosinus sp.]